jgi:hypothetical protein
VIRLDLAGFVALRRHDDDTDGVREADIVDDATIEKPPYALPAAWARFLRKADEPRFHAWIQAS